MQHPQSVKHTCIANSINPSLEWAPLSTSNEDEWVLRLMEIQYECTYVPTAEYCRSIYLSIILSIHLFVSHLFNCLSLNVHVWDVITVHARKTLGVFLMVPHSGCCCFWKDGVFWININLLVVCVFLHVPPHPTCILQLLRQLLHWYLYESIQSAVLVLWTAHQWVLRAFSLRHWCCPSSFSLRHFIATIPEGGLGWFPAVLIVPHQQWPAHNQRRDRRWLCLGRIWWGTGLDWRPLLQIFLFTEIWPLAQAGTCMWPVTTLFVLLCMWIHVSESVIGLRILLWK